MSEPIRAKKSLGQNFLVDPNYQRKIIAALDPQPDDVVIEIGPGTGALTKYIVGQVASCTAIELDDRLAAALQTEYGQRDDFRLIHQDVMTVDFQDLVRNFAISQPAQPAQPKVVGNIPYNITTPLLFKLLERTARPALILVMVQKEVADRIVAPAGDREYGALSVGVQSVAEAERLFVVPRGAFRPVPKIDSAVVRIVPRMPPELTPAEESDLRSLTRAAFSWRRKQLQNTLRHAPGYELTVEKVQAFEKATGLEASKRPEQFTPREFIAIVRALRALGYPLT